MDELQLHGVCPCGHAVSWHAEGNIAHGSGSYPHVVHGCQFKADSDNDNPSRDEYDFCTCPAVRSYFDQEEEKHGPD